MHLFIRRMIKHIVVITEAYRCRQVHMTFYRHFICRLPLFVEESIGYHYYGLGLERFSYHLFRCPQLLVKMGIQWSRAVRKIFMALKEAYDSFRRQDLYIVL